MEHLAIAENYWKVYYLRVGVASEINGMCVKEKRMEREGGGQFNM